MGASLRRPPLASVSADVPRERMVPSPPGFYPADGTAPLRRAAGRVVKDGHPRATCGRFGWGRFGHCANCRNPGALRSIRLRDCAPPAGCMRAAPIILAFGLYPIRQPDPCRTLRARAAASARVGGVLNMSSGYRNAAVNSALQSSYPPDCLALFAVSIATSCACRASRSSEFFELINRAPPAQWTARERTFAPHPGADF